MVPVSTALAPPSLDDALRSLRLGVLVLASVRDDAGAIVDFRCAELNPEAAVLLGRSVQDIRDASLARIVPDAAGRGLVHRLARIVEGGTGDALTIDHHVGGIDTCIEAQAVRHADGVALSLTDITNDHRNQTRALEQHADLLTTIGEIQSSYIIGADARAVFGRMLEGFLKTTSSEYGFIGEVWREEDGTQYLKTHAITDISWNEETRLFFAAHAPTGLEFRNMRTLFGSVMVTGDVVIANTPASDPRAGGLPPGHPRLDAFLGLPLYSGGVFVGMVGLANRPGGFEPEMVERLKPFTATAANLIAAERLERERRATSEALVRAKQRAEAANEAKSRFIAIMSHELRTPLNAIIGFAEIMRDQVFGPLGDKRYVEYTGDVLSSGRHLLGLINDILDVSRLDNDAMPLRMEMLMPGAVVQECVRNLGTKLRDRHLSIRWDINAETRSCLLDRRALRQIVLNLLSNAVKFSREGGSIGVALERRADELHLLIEDEGPGFDQEVFERVGAPFLQVGAAFAREHGGAGLGLSIVKRLAELHGGTLAIGNRAEGGARVEVTLKLGTPGGDP